MAPAPINLAKLSWKDVDIEGSLSAYTSMFLRFVAIMLFAPGEPVPIVKATLPAAAIARFPFGFGQSG